MATDTPLSNRRFLRLEDSELEQRLCAKVAKFKGQSTTLESALGALILGQHYGTRVLRMVHSPSTYRKYERILGVKFDDLCPESTELSKRNVGYSVAKRVGAFWDVVMGRRKVEGKGQLHDSVKEF